MDFIVNKETGVEIFNHRILYASSWSKTSFTIKCFYLSI